MTTGRHSQVFQQLRQAVLAHDGAGLTDADLLSRFVAQRDGAALEALIRRHGSMVWSVCRRVLSNEQDAEDAFQASFLVFVRKAASIRGREQVGSWLYGVAYRTALKARTTDARRRAKERRAAEMIPTQTEADADWSELLPVLDQELNRLPDKYRTALVLCELEGRPRKEAARQLGIPEGTLSSRLATGKRMLAKRFGRPGLALSAGALAASATVPPTLLASTVKAVTSVAVGQAAVAGVVSVRVASLAEGVIKAMLLTRISAGVVLLTVVAVLAAGTGTAVYCAPAGRPDAKPPTAPAASVQHQEGKKDKEEVKKEETEWGEAVDGVQARIRPVSVEWELAAGRHFALDLRNQGKQAHNMHRDSHQCEIELDGKWYVDGDLIKLYKVRSTPLEPGQQLDDLFISLTDVLWVRKTPGRKVGDPVGDKDEVLQLTAGKHTLRIAFVFEDGLRPISQPLQIEKDEDAEWGEAVDGVQARLRPAEARWDAGAPPEFALDMRNRGEKRPYQCRVPNFCRIEWDGKWYRWGGSSDLECKSTVLEPAKQIDDWVKVSLKVPWLNGRPASIKGSEPLVISAGKHKLRVSFTFEAGEFPGTNIKREQGVRVVSQLVNVEVGKESSWGEAVDGVQARIRTPKVICKTDEAPTFHLDLRNQGKKTPNQRRVPYDCQIEVDKVWYSFDEPSGPYVSVGELLKPGAEVDNWTTVSPDKNWGSFPGKAQHFPLPPGKHMVRIAYRLQGTTPALRPISGPIEIEISDKAADGAKARPTGGAAPAAGGNKETPARRAVDIQRRLSKTINYDLAVDTTLDKALDELLGSRGIPWTVNDAAFGPDNKDVVKKTAVGKIDPIQGATVATVLNRLLAKIPNSGGKMTPIYLIRPDRLEITTQGAYLAESYPNRNPLLPPPSYLPPPAYAVFDKVPLSEALAELANTTGGNVVVASYVGKKAETKITAELNGVPLDAAVTVLADMADLKCVRLGNVYYVTTPERARLLEKEEQERRLEEEKAKEEPAKPPVNKTDAKK